MNEERLAALTDCYRDGSLQLTERDKKKPAQFILKPSDIFPWDVFFEGLVLSWQMCDYEGVPKAFQPVKRIPQFVLDGFLNESIPNKLKILATLRSQGFFQRLKSK